MKATRKFLSIILALTSLLSLLGGASLSANAASYSGYCGDDVKYSFNKSTKTLTISGTGAMYDFENLTPDVYDLDAIDIDSPWYSYRDSIKRVIIENGVTAIGEYAFYYSSNLESVFVPDSVKTIGAQICYGCFSLTDFRISDKITKIGEYAFCKTSLGGTLTIPAAVKKVGMGAFEETLYKKAVINCNSLAEDEFVNCYYLKKVEINGKPKSFPRCVFSGCERLSEINIPSSVTKLGDYALSQTAINKIKLPKSLKKIGAWCFEDCTKLTSITIPNKVTKVGRECFRSCKRLKKIKLSKNLTAIPYGFAFGCRSLKKIYIPKKVKKIGYCAFGIKSGVIFYDHYEEIKYVKGFKVYSPNNKAAKKYAKKHHFKHIYKK